ncbi:MAG: hypothetical protein HFI58_07235 [Lachnospiraceae bacterium]|nr:hypothetical protein [Lachnospiraceae bacterium]
MLTAVASSCTSAQRRFFDILLQGMTQEEMEGMRRCMDHIFDNINRYLK